VSPGQYSFGACGILRQHDFGKGAAAEASPNPIETHLRRVFAKTATGRQAELAGLIAAVGSVRIPDSDAGQ
jgi:hypothetical protein